MCYAGTGQLVNGKIIRNKNTAVSEGYGFVEFATHEAAEQVLRTFNGCPIPNTDQIFRLNWAAFGVGKVTTDGESPPPPMNILPVLLTCTMQLVWVDIPSRLICFPSWMGVALKCR